MSNGVASHFLDFSHGSLSTIPSNLWKYYLEYLWFYEPGSWVARIAYTFRVLAFLLIIPMTGITLLDIASYVIARTLGVVDDVKASTSDKNTIHAKGDAPIILLNDASSPVTIPSPPPAIHTHNPVPPKRSKEKVDTTSLALGGQPQTYFASDEMDLRLSGVDVFSPAASRPSSPALSRRNLLEMDSKGNRLEGSMTSATDGSRLRKREPCGQT